MANNTRKNNARKNNARKNNTRRNNMMGGFAAMAKPAMPHAMPAAHKGGAKMTTVGSRAQVFHGTAQRTSGGLTRKDLKKNKHGRIVSVKASAAGRKALKFLHRKGFVAKKGTFKLFH